MDYRFKRCLEKRKLIKISVDERRIKKEIDSAIYDLRMARDSLGGKDFKWATVKAYYTFFHLGKAILFSKGYREKTHFCLMIGLKELLVDKGELDDIYLKNFEDAMNLREEADYDFKFSEGGARETVSNAKDFLNKTKEILGR